MTQEADYIQPRFIHEFQYDEFVHMKRNEVSKLITKPAFKVLKLSNCLSVSALNNDLKPNSVQKKDAIHKRATNLALIKNAPYLLCIIFELIEDIYGEKLKDLILALESDIYTEKPLIVQILQPKINPVIYYKEETRSHFVFLRTKNMINDEEFKAVLKSEIGCSLETILRALHSNLFGEFNGNLIDIKLDRRKLEPFIKEGIKFRSLSIRLLHLFVDKLTENFWMKLIECSLATASSSNFLALLGLPFTLEEGDLKLSQVQEDILNGKFSLKNNLLMLSIEKNNAAVVNSCSKLGIDVNKADINNIKPFDLAYSLKHHQCQSELIKADARFPFNFTPTSNEISTLVDERNKFHDNIELGSTDEVKFFLENWIHLKYAYNTKNCSALTTAITAKQFDIYALLRSVGFEHEHGFDRAFANLNRNERMLITKANRKYVPWEDNHHLTFFLSRSRLGFHNKNRSGCFRKIREIYGNLYKIDQIAPILKAVASSEQLVIVFDFNSKSVSDKDITHSHILWTGYIYIGANDYEKSSEEILGTLAHELTHYAMKLVYENQGKPFYEKDSKTFEQFKKILNNVRLQCLRFPDFEDKTVHSIFKFYYPVAWIAELIACVPEILAKYNSKREKLSKFEIRFEPLFSFFHKKTIKDLCERAEEPKPGVQEMNRMIGLIKEIDSYGLRFQQTFSFEMKRMGIVIFSSQEPIITLAMLVQFFRDSCGDKFDEIKIFASVENIQDSESFKKIKTLFKSPLEPHLMINCIDKYKANEEMLGNVSNLFGSTRNIILVMTQKESEEMKISFPESDQIYLDVDHKWEDFNDETKTQLLEQNIFFQSCSVKLSEIASMTSKVLPVLSLNDLAVKKQIEIGMKIIRGLHKFYILRTFIKKEKIHYSNNSELILVKNGTSRDSSANYKPIEVLNLGELLTEAEKNGLNIISDVAGSGKSTSLKEIARTMKNKMPTCFVLLVDLKQHIKEFDSVEASEAENFPTCIANIILKSRHLAEKELFKELYEKGKVVVLLDGFDEISPNFNKLILKLMKSFDINSKNQLWVTTRSDLENDLEEIFIQNSFGFLPLSKEDYKNFLMDSWKEESSQDNEKPKQSLNEIASNIIEKLSVISEKNFIGLPLLISMIATIFQKNYRSNDFRIEQIDNFNLFSLYELFVFSMIDIRTEKENRDKNEKKQIHLQQNRIKVVHEKLALLHIFGPSVMSDEDFLNECSCDIITKTGIIVEIDVSTKQCEFLHKTIAEFLVSNYISHYIKNSFYMDGALIESFALILKDKGHRTIRKFLENSVINLNLNESQQRKFGERLEFKIKEMECFDIIQNVLKEGNHKLAKFVLDCLRNFSIDVLKKILKLAEKDGSSSLHLASKLSDRFVLESICELIENRFSQKDQKKFFQLRDQNNQNIFLLAASNTKHEEMFPTLQNCVEKVLDREEIKSLLQEKNVNNNNILSLIAIKNNNKQLPDAMLILRTFLTDPEMTILIRNKDIFGNNCLHNAARFGNKSFLEFILTFLDVFCTIQEQRDLFRSRGFQKKNIFLQVASNTKHEEIFPTLQNFVEKFFDREEIKSLLQEKNSNGDNVLSLIAIQNNQKQLHDAICILRSSLSDPEMKILVRSKDKAGNNCLHNAARFGNKTIIKSSFSLLESLLTIKEQKDLFQSRGFENGNIFLQAAFNTEHEQIFSTLQKFLEKVFDQEEMKSLLQEKNADGDNVLGLIATQNNEKQLPDAMSILRTFLTYAEIKLLIRSRDKFGDNCLHKAARFGFKSYMKSFFSFLESFFTIEEQKDLFRSRGSENKNIFLQAAFNTEHEQIFSTLRKLSQKLFDHEEIKSLLQEKNADGDNVFSLIAIQNNEKQLPDAMSFLQTFLTYAEIKILVQNKDKLGDNCLHKAARFGFKSYMKSFFSFLESFFTIEEQKDLFRSRGSENKNIFLQAAFNTEHEEIFSTLQNCVEKLFDREEIKSLLQEKNSNGDNVLGLIAIQNNEKQLPDTICILRSFFSDAEIATLVREKNEFGNNCLKNAARFGNKSLIKSFFTFLENLLEQ